MSKETKEKLAKHCIIAARVCHALGHPTRYKIFYALNGGQRSNTELCEFTKSSKSSISQHLDVMEYAGLVKRGHVGRTRVISLCYEASAGILKALFAFAEERLKGDKE